MIINGKQLLSLTPIKNMLGTKEKEHGVSHGLGEAGYDIRINQNIIFDPAFTTVRGKWPIVQEKDERGHIVRITDGRFIIASAMEEFDMPPNLVGVVHDKSTWARRGLSVFNTVIEPSWKGFLTLELVFHGNTYMEIPKGAGIAQVLFSSLAQEGFYAGKYQYQDNRPVPAILEKG